MFVVPFRACTYVRVCLVAIAGTINLNSKKKKKKKNGHCASPIFDGYAILDTTNTLL